MKNYWWVLVIIVFIGGLIAWSHFASGPGGYRTVADNSALPGIESGNAPWAPELHSLKARLSADGLPALATEGTALHTHEHLDIFINGEAIPIPPEIGINDTEHFISPIHVHDTTGVIHVESPVAATFTLGQFFDIWGVRFSAHCIGGYCADGANTLKVWVNGEPYTGDPRMLALEEHQEIVIAYGSTPMKDVPRSFEFEAGL